MKKYTYRVKKNSDNEKKIESKILIICTNAENVKYKTKREKSAK